MSPEHFPKANLKLTGPAGIGDLPVHRSGGQITSCWRMTWRERLSALLWGRAWLTVLSPETQPPVSLEVRR